MAKYDLLVVLKYLHGRIRASAGSASSSSDIPLKALPEEVRCLGLVADAEKWLNKAKKLMQVRNT